MKNVGVEEVREDRTAVRRLERESERRREKTRQKAREKESVARTRGLRRREMEYVEARLILISVHATPAGHPAA